MEVRFGNDFYKQVFSSYESAVHFRNVAIGLVPQNEVFAGLVPLDGRGYIISGEDCLTETAGVFAAGDCRTKAIRQVTTAVADGAVAALAACAYADNMQ